MVSFISYESYRKLYISSKKWVEHMKQEHNDTTPFKCEHPGCDFKTSQSAGLNNHLKIHRTYRKDLISITFMKIIYVEPIS